MPDNFKQTLKSTLNNTKTHKIFYKSLFNGFTKFIFLLFIIATGIFLWASIIEPNSLTLNNHNIKLKSWQKEHSGLKLLLISDIHAGSPFIDEKKLDQIVKLANDQKPDLVFLLGDYVIQGVVNGKFIKPKIISKKLAKLKSKYGVYAILGNHDAWYNPHEVKQSLLDNNIEVLDNKIKRLSINKKTLWIAGTEDLTSQKPDLNKCLFPIKDNNTVLLLSHDPDLFPILPNRNLLVLSGHSHGGQIKIPFGKPVISISRYGNKFSSGFFSQNNKSLFVTTGIGTSVLPLRFNVPPEIVILNLF